MLAFGNLSQVTFLSYKGLKRPPKTLDTQLKVNLTVATKVVIASSNLHQPSLQE